MRLTYQLSVVPGLAALASREVRERLDLKPLGSVRLRNAELLFVAGGIPVPRLLELRLVEDVFVALMRLKLTGQVADMRAVARAGAWGAPLREALALWSQVTGRPLVKRQPFRVVVQADDVAWRHYRRQELMLAAERGLLNAGASWRLSRDQAPLEIWLQQAGRELLLSVRLSASDLRQHGGRVVERAAALRPSIAAALVRLTQPADDDVFLDPMCGAGTILLERAVAGRYQQLIGGDSDEAAVVAALANFGSKHQPRRIERLDATALPLAAGSVTTLATNLPWGRQVSEQAALPALYAGVLREAGRVVRPGGRLVFLTSEWDLLKRVLRERPELSLVQTVSNVEILGRRADIFVAVRRG